MLQRTWKNGYDVTLEHDEASPKDKLTPTTLDSNTSHTKNNFKTVVILGGSMMKQTNDWEISKKLQSNTKVSVKHFMCAKTRCMDDYSKPSLYDPHNHFTLHVRTNDLRSEETIAKSI